MGTLQSWRKAYGALKDHTKVGLAHVNSDFKRRFTLGIGCHLVKNECTCNNVTSVRMLLAEILVATSAIRPRADVAYCIHAFARRLTKTHNWTVALKTLIVIHRTLREAWDCSAWVRTYALFLEERLECFRILKYDIEAERLPRPAQGQDKGYSRTRDLDSEELLDQLPALQQLLYRLIGCRPEGAAVGNYVIQYASPWYVPSLHLPNCINMRWLYPKSVSVHERRQIGILNTKLNFFVKDGKGRAGEDRGGIGLRSLRCIEVGTGYYFCTLFEFFEMPRHEAIKALDIYKRAGQQAIGLSDFYEICKGLELARNFQFPVLREPPQSFLVTMEEYIKEAPRMVSVPSVALEYPERLMLTYKEEDVPSPSEETKVPLEESRPPHSDEVAVSTAEPAAIPPPPPTNLDMDDLLGLNAITQDASAIEENNALALAIVPSGTTSLDSESSQAKAFDPTGWELALVTTPSTNLSSAQERQLAGGLDSLTLNSLYDEGAYRASQQPVYGAPAPNPFEVTGLFAIPNAMPTTPPTVQMGPITHQNNPFGPFQPAFPQQQLPLTSPQNPFGDAGFGAFPGAPNAHPPTSNPFGGPGFL
ncbi:hypothetical protein DH2020_020623 [Rehmannia glutinosa]|uniref:ENTH domain-containing protein n=1 Tax=Rehmannia glutinosa TaxID=99300 RepID=A0ABR0WI42_REHGL